MAYNTDQKPGESIDHWYRRLAKTADQRLVRLEGYRHQDYFKTATQWAYAGAMQDIQKWSGPDATRFNVAPPESEQDKLAKISDMRKFIESPSSTKQGIINIYKKRAETFNKGRYDEKENRVKGNFGTQFTWQDIALYYESGMAQKWSDRFGSETALRTIAVIQKNRNKIKKAIDKGRLKDLRVPPTGDKTLDQTVKIALQDNNLELENLL